MTRFKGVPKTRKKPIIQKNQNDFEIKWDNVNVTTKKSLNSEDSTHHILRNISGDAKSGQLVAVMGNSGAGKTTLLEALGGRLPREFTMTGNVWVNGENALTFLTNRSAFVEQFQRFPIFMTVREYLLYQFVLRLKSSKIGNIDEEIDEILFQTGLGGCQNCLIGDPGIEKGISGGERKKLAFACELIGNGRIFFCDEPTTGLDSFAAHECVSTLRRVVNTKNVLAIFTIHQPSSSIVNMFDKIILISDSGRIAYEGDVPSALKFFDSRFQLKCPETFNPCDFFLNIVRVNFDSTSVNRICDVFDYERIKQSYTKGEKFNEEREPGNCGATLLNKIRQVATKEYKTGTLNQIRTLLWRELIFFKRTWILFIAKLMPMLMLIYVVLVYGNQPLNRVGATNLTGLLSIYARLATSHNMISGALVTVQTAPFLKKDYQNGLYGVGCYVFCRAFVELPLFCFFETLLMSVLFYFNIGLQVDIQHFSVFLLFAVFTSIAGNATGHLIGVAFPDLNTALVCCGFIDPLLDVFMGFMIRIKSIPIALRWLRYLFFCYYGYQSLVINQWADIDKIDCEFGHSTLCYSNGKDVLMDYGIDEGDLYYNLIYLVILSVFIKLFTYVFLLLKLNWK